MLKLRRIYFYIFFSVGLLASFPHLSSALFSAQEFRILFALGMAIVMLIWGVLEMSFLKKKRNVLIQELQKSQEKLKTFGDNVEKEIKNLNSEEATSVKYVEVLKRRLPEVSKFTVSNTQEAEGFRDYIGEAHQVSNNIHRKIEDLSQAMGAILESNQRIENLVHVIEEIGSKTKVIDEIVFKTQLLSFNASVEAERAGVNGRGFSVVAQEVGNLAQMSGKAALQISTIVKNSIREASVVADENRTRVATGSHLASECKTEINRSLQIFGSAQTKTELMLRSCRDQRDILSYISNALQSLEKSILHVGKISLRILNEEKKETASKNLPTSTQEQPDTVGAKVIPMPVAPIPQSPSTSALTPTSPPEPSKLGATGTDPWEEI